MRWLRILFTLTVLAVSLWTAPSRSAEPKPISPEEFEKVHKMIKPQPGESRWAEVPWLTCLWEARQKAAAEGKPILLWTAHGAAPIAPC